MGLYTLSEMMQLILEDIGIADLPIVETVGLDKIKNRLEQSTLKELSVRYPYQNKIFMGDGNLLHKNQDSFVSPYGIDYKIPVTEIAGHSILGISNIVPRSVSGFGDSYIPYTAMFSPDAIISTVADVQMMSDVGRNIAKSLTWDFRKPDIIRIFNGWMSGEYEVSLLLTHDMSLATLPDTAMTNFRRLGALDVEAFLYNRFKRIDNIDTGVGTIDLKISDWADAMDKFNEMLDEIGQSNNLDTDSMFFL